MLSFKYLLKYDSQRMDKMKNKEAIKLLSAIAQENRLKILKMIISSEKEGLCPCHMIEDLDMTNAGLSSHLRVLEDARLISKKKRGKFIHYFADCKKIKNLGDFLIEGCSKYSCGDNIKSGV